MNILSIQSWVAYGHVGNASAMFPIQRLGHEVWAVNTVQFSNHTGYGAWKGQVFAAEAVREVVDGIADRGVLASCDGVLSGYMGDASIGEAILDAVARVKAANPRALYCCDPVMGDVGRGMFVRPGIPEFMKAHAVTAADIITPNHFELEYLAGMEARDHAALKKALSAVHSLGPRIILATSVHTQETPDESLDVVISVDGKTMIVRTPLLPISVSGAGDATAALLFVHLLEGRAPGEATGLTASSIYGLLKRTADAGSREILSVAAQDEFVSPTVRFDAEPV